MNEFSNEMAVDIDGFNANDDSRIVIVSANGLYVFDVDDVLCLGTFNFGGQLPMLHILTKTGVLHDFELDKIETTSMPFMFFIDGPNTALEFMAVWNEYEQQQRMQAG